MTNYLGGWWVALVSVVLAAGCNPAGSSEAATKRSQALTPGPTFTLQLPPQLTSGGSGLTATTTLTLGDRVKVKQPTGSAFAGVVNLGSSLTIIGRDNNTGDVWSVGSVQLGDRSVINGFLKTAGTLAPGVNTTITGVLQQSQPLTLPTLATVTVQFQSGASAVPVANDVTRTLSPGDYAAVSLGARAVLALSTGDYRFDSLATQLPSTLRLTTTAGPIRIFVRNTLTWNSTVTAAAGDPTKLLVGYVGTAAITINTPFTGTLLSPNAVVTLPTGSSPHSGAFFAKSLSTEPDVVVTTRPFQQPCQGVVIDDGNACTTDACDPNTGVVSHLPVANGTACSDGSACTGSDSCQAGVCVGASPVVCTAQDQCHGAGVCAPATGLCSNPNKANGSSCSDGSVCTQSDSCQAGACVGANPVTCAAQDQCHSVGTCDAVTGVCSNPLKANGSACADGNACTQSDTCQAGACVGTNPVLCTALDQCHVAGACNSATGVCSNPVLPNGSTCSDGNACTQTDSCQAGTCTGASTVACSALDQCHVAGSCDPTSGVCSNPTKADGSGCSDGNACTQADLCQSGSCVGASPVVCAALDQCHVAGTCSSATGACSNPTKANGSACSDGNSCTQSDACQTGACVGGNPVVCTALDQCHIPGSCDTSSGTCSNPAKGDGTACNDANVCTTGEVCTTGLCKSGSTVATDDGNPCTADACDPSGGVSHTPVTAGTACDDSDLCNGHETCNAIGFCSAGQAVLVDDGNPCTSDSCDAQGVHHAPVVTGTSCANANVCDGVETCNGTGVCAAGLPLAVDDGNPCTADSCDPTSGVKHQIVGNGVSCADANACNGNETCQQGSCTAGSPVIIDDGNPCTVDSCDASSGIQHVLAAAGTVCSAANDCGGAGECNTGGQCIQASTDDGNPCTIDRCDHGIESHVPALAGTACASIDACHSMGACDAIARCNPGPPVSHDDADPCTLETCDPSTGFKQRSCAPVDPTVATVLADANAWLYSGSDPLQTGVLPGAITRTRASLLKGRVLTRDGFPLSGARMTIAGRQEFGSTVTQTNGEFELMVNGGSPLSVRSQKVGFLTADRAIDVGWSAYVSVPDITLIQSDPIATTVDLAGLGSDFGVVKGMAVSDASGQRQPTVLVPGGTVATMVKADGTTAPLSQLHIRVTEFTVGPEGPTMMPAALPATSAYTHAFEINADEAVASGAVSVQFSQPLVYYLDNFLQFPVGGAVPLGSYDRTLGAWRAEKSGTVIQIVGVVNGVARVNINADPAAESPAQLAAAGISAAEQAKLGELYMAGQSLWRVQLPHFTSPYDCNWAQRVPNATPPVPPDNSDDNDNVPDDPCQQSGGSTIECQNQTLREELPIAGTPFKLTYSSERVHGRRGKFTTLVPLSGIAVPTDPIPLLRIEMDVDVVGRHFHEEFPPVVNQSYSFEWDGLDAFGREVQGIQQATVSVSYMYPSRYADGTLIFAGFPALTDGAGPTRTDIPITRTWIKRLGNWDQARGPRLGGWTLDVHHDYDVNSRVLTMGSGDTVRADAIPSRLVPLASLGQGNPGIAVAPDGTVFGEIGGGTQVVKIVNGVPVVIAGILGAPRAATGDGGPAAAATFYSVSELGMDAGGNLLIVDGSEIRRIGPDGIISRFAGTGADGFSGDGGPAIAAKILPSGLGCLALNDGKVYLAEQTNRIRVIENDGTIRTVAGTGVQPATSNPPPNGSPAALTPIFAQALAFDGIGNMYVTSPFGFYVEQIRRDGSMYTVAGCGPACQDVHYGVPATQSAIQSTALAAAPDGTLWLTVGRASPLPPALARITQDGILQFIAPNDGFNNLKWGPDTLYMAYGVANNGGAAYFASKLSPAMPGVDLTSFLVPSDDGTQAFVFDPSGRHLQTRDAITGAQLYQFGYDSNGLLQQIADAFGNVTRIERADNGTPLAIVGPYGQRSSLSIGGDGLLSALTDPAQNTATMEYEPGGLLSTFTNVRGLSSLMSYDSLGRITTDVDPASATKIVTRTELSDGWKTDIQNSDAGQSTYEVHRLTNGTQLRKNTFSDGTSASTTIDLSGTATSVLADGTTIVRSKQPDPRFGLAAPLETTTTTLPSGLTRTVTPTRTVTLASSSNPFSVLTLQNRVTFGSFSATETYSSATRTWTAVSAGGVTRATDLDANDNPVSIHTLAASGGEFMFPTNLGYDTHGRLSSTTRGTRVERQTYFDTSDGSNGYLASHINPLSQETDYTRDSLGRALSELAPDLGETGYSWDAASNLTSVTPPGRPSHSMNYTAVDQLASYTPPTLASVQTPQTVFEYNFARQLTKVTRPDGVVLDYHYDSAGRLLTVTTPSGTLTNTYFPVAPCVGCAPGRLSQIAGFDGVNLSFTFDGFLPTKYTWSGAISGSVNNTYNTEFLLSTETVNAGNRSSSVSFAYDGDGSPILVGPMRITSRADDGQIASTRLGNLQDFISYNRLGELADQTTLLSSTVFRETYDSVIAPRDALGRIVRKSETLRDQQTAFDYTYDSASRLKTVKTDGVLTATYFYDTNGNRLTATKPSGSVSATYDDQDRLLTYGKFSYAYTANGELQRKTDTVSGAATTYNYDAFGNLKQVNLPSGDTVEYLVDGQNRRVAKKKNGAIVKQWLYRDGIHPVAELDASGNLVSTFVYVTGKNVPDYVVQSGGTFRILSDQIGSPRLVLEATTGALVQRLRHDEFGNVLEDTSPAFIPFGFGGGLYDVDTGLVRFGARDYDPVVGRWISKDPIRFDGGQANLYGYVNNDPIQNVDEDGLALRACAKALAKLAAAEARLAKRRFENMASSCGSDPGHDKAIDEAQNAVANASEQVARNCTAKDLVVLGAAGLLAGAVGSLSGGGGFAFAF